MGFTSLKLRNSKIEKIAAPVLISVFFFLFVWAVYTFLPVHANANPPQTWGFSVDWKGCIRPDTLKFLSGHSPYTEGCGLNPPWAYLLLAPIAALPVDLGAATMFALTYMIYALVLLRMGAKPWMIAAFTLSRLPLISAFNGNIDFLPVLGFILPPPLALFFLAIKPQIGIGLALFYVVEAWREDKVKAVVKLITPISVVYLISFAVYGLYPLKLLHMPNDPFNASLFPAGLVLAIPLLIYALIKRQKLTAIATAPLLAPYTNIHSYAVLLFAFIPYQVPFLFAVALTWLTH